MGWSDVVQNVVQRYSVEDAGATSTLTELASSAIGVASTLASVEYTYNRVMGLIGRGQSMLMGAVNLGAQRQELELTIAGTLRAYEVSGARMADINRRFTAGTQGWRDATIEAFNTAQGRASGVLAQITRDADALPGEAEQYLQTFQTAMPAALSATRRSLEEITDLSNTFTATALVNQIDAPQAGRDLMLMLQGSAGMDVRTWRTLQALVHNPGRDTWANMTDAQRQAAANDPARAAHRWQGGDSRQMQATEFNRLTGEQRFEAIRRALEVYKPLLDRMSHTWSTQIGTFTAGVERLKRVMAMPIFESALNLLTKVNEKLNPIMTRLATIGAVFTGYVARGIEYITSRVDEVWKRMNNFINEVVNGPIFNQLFARFEEVFNTLSYFLRPILGSNSGRTGIIASIFGTAGAIFSNIITDKRLLTAMDTLVRVFSYVVDHLSPIFSSMGNFQLALSDLVVRGIILAAQALEVFVHQAWQVWSLIRAFGTVIGWVVSPLYRFVTTLLGATSPGSMLITVLEGLFFVLKLVVAYIGTAVLVSVFALVAAINFVTLPLQLLARALVSLVRYVNSILPASRRIPVDSITEALANTFQSPQFLNDISAAIAGMSKQSKNPADNARDRQPTPHVGQDFRYSRFDITQRFAEGFDPDRVASAFAEDLAGLAENRLQSGFQPAFTTTG